MRKTSHGHLAVNLLEFDKAILGDFKKDAEVLQAGHSDEPEVYVPTTGDLVLASEKARTCARPLPARSTRPT